MSDTLDLARLEKLLGEATPGPWEDKFAHWGKADVVTFTGCEDSKSLINGRPYREVVPYIDPTDAELIALARSALPHLLSRVSELESALNWLDEHKNLELHHYSPVYADDDDDTVEWRVTRVSGSINDREWDTVGRGETPLAAILQACHVLGEKA